ncbi:unnamed protein product, partial [Rotaria magnacalcarata]
MVERLAQQQYWRAIGSIT